jgi:hypothetical protein
LALTSRALEGKSSSEEALHARDFCALHSVEDAMARDSEAKQRYDSLVQQLEAELVRTSRWIASVHHPQ